MTVPAQFEIVKRAEPAKDKKAKKTEDEKTELVPVVKVSDCLPCMLELSARPPHLSLAFSSQPRLSKSPVLAKP